MSACANPRIMNNYRQTPIFYASKDVLKDFPTLYEVPSNKFKARDLKPENYDGKMS